MSILILHHSHTGNNRYLAGMLADRLDADVRALDPWPSHPGPLFLASWLRLPVRIALRDDDLRGVDEVVVCGPVWGGLLIAPCRAAIRRAAQAGCTVHFITCCGTSDAQKDDRYGYAGTLRMARAAGGDRFGHADAVSLALTTDGAATEDRQTIRLDEENVQGRFSERVDAFAARIRRPASAHS